MYYFSPCPLPADESVVSAWDSELRRIKTPWIEQLLAQQGQELFQRFTASYNELRALPRNARRGLQRKIARSEDGTIPAEWRRKLAYSIAGAALLVALGQTVSEAAGPKPIKLSTKCSLVNAIYAANYANAYGVPVTKTSYIYSGCTAAVGPNTIILPKTAYTMISPASITSPIIIQGAKPKKPKKGQPFVPGTGGTLHAPAGSAAFYVTYGSLTLYNVTITGGAAFGYGGVIYNGNGASTSLTISAISGASSVRGGGIFNRGNLTINGSKISGNTADYGGGIFNDNYGNLTVASATVLGTLVGSTITGNHADYSGGGIYNAYTATITNSTVSNNTAVKNGGGVANGPGGTLSITSSTLTGNTAYKGGAIHNAQVLTVTSSTISDNTANYGGGLYNGDQADATLTSSTVSGNHATVSQKTDSYNNLYYFGGYGGGINNHGGLTINSSTINGSNTAEGKVVTYNETTTNYGGRGGGIHNSSYIYLNNSSVTGNTAMFVAGGVYNLPLDATLQINNSTITGNSAAANADVFP